MRSKVVIIWFAVFLVTACSIPLDRRLEAPLPDGGTMHEDGGDGGGYAEGEVWARLRSVYRTSDDGSRFTGEHYFWGNPWSPYLANYAQYVYGPLRGQDRPQPLTHRPFYDTVLKTVCLFYQTSDGATRCLPGWVQIEADDQRDGYYSEPSCSQSYQWLHVLPTSATQGPLAQRFLVLAKPSGALVGNFPETYEAVLYEGRVWNRYFNSTGVRVCEEIADRTALKFYTRGAAQMLTLFVKLGDLTIGASPG